jgi:drug/metabolite transporter (DMT)-like permease
MNSAQAPSDRLVVRLHPLLALLLANLALAIGPWFVREAQVGPAASGFWRMALALPILFAMSRVMREPALPGKRALAWLLVPGLFFAADIASWHAGILMTKLANATLLGNTASLLFPVYGFLIARAWPSRVQGIALGLALAGGGMLMGRSYDLSPRHFTGDLLSLAAGIFYTFYLVFMGRARESMPQWSVLAWSTLASAVPLLGLSLMLGERIIPGAWWPLVALAVCSQVIGQGLLVLSLGRLSPLVIGLAFLIQPFIAALLGWVAYGERLALADWAGGAMVALALVLVRQPGKPA